MIIGWLLACSPSPIDPTYGQWIWSDADVAVFEQSRGALPDLVPTVWIGTLHDDGRMELGHSPRGLSNPAVILRVDADWRWDRTDAEAVTLLDTKIDRIQRMVAAAGVVPRELQIDYDCPISKLARYAAVLGGLRARQPWITSLASHLEEPAYGDLFRGVVAGHILQVFDTGDDPGSPERLRQTLDRAAMPFRLGLGAFERADQGVPITKHRAWFSTSGPIRRSVWYRGTWVFPAGRSWTALLQEP